VAEGVPIDNGSDGGAGAESGGGGPEPCYFFELGNTSDKASQQVVLVEVVAGVSFSEDELSPKAHRLLQSGRHALCKVVSANTAAGGAAGAVAGAGGGSGTSSNSSNSSVVTTSVVGLHGEYENVNVDSSGLALATEACFKAAAPYGAEVAATAVFGRIGGTDYFFNVCAKKKS
jgi:hypothetical protein